MRLLVLGLSIFSCLSENFRDEVIFSWYTEHSTKYQPFEFGTFFSAVTFGLIALFMIGIRLRIRVELEPIDRIGVFNVEKSHVVILVVAFPLSSAELTHGHFLALLVPSNKI